MNTLAGYPPLAEAYRVAATRWEYGWELVISDAEHGEIGVTCTHETCTSETCAGDCADAEHMVRDYLATVHELTDAEAEAISIEIVYAA